MGAERVRGDEVVSRAPDGAAVIERFGIGVGQQGCKVGSETLAQFDAEAVVVGLSVGMQELDSRSRKFRIGQAGDHRSGPGNRLASIDQIAQMSPFPTVTATLPTRGFS